MVFEGPGGRVSLWSLGIVVSLFLLVLQPACSTQLSTAAAQSPAGDAGVAPVEFAQSGPDELFAFARDYAASKGYRFGTGADVMLRNRTGLAVQEMADLSALQRKEKTTEAKRNIARFIDAMIAASKEIPGYAERTPGVIGEQTYDRAERRLCPIWPICR